MRDSAAQAHEAGTTVVRNTITLGFVGVGAPLRNAARHPIGALSVATLTQFKVQRIAQSLKATCAVVERKLCRGK